MLISFGRPEVMANISGGDSAPGLFGSVKFYSIGNGCLVVVDIYGLPDSDTGIFGLHVHEGMSCTGEAYADSGSHFNPTNGLHPNHAGDLPPLISCHGNAFMAVRTDRFTPWDVLDKTVIIHSGPDDFSTQPAGNAGEKIACGVIVKY